jgi:hypothetical protein
MTRGGRRPRWMPASVPVSSPGRWGRRRVRVSQCTAVIAAEMVYDNLVCDGQTFGPGWRGTLSWKPHGDVGASWNIKTEVLANAVWRCGRLFLRCRHCDRRATKLYVPTSELEPRCRRCWGLSYESRSWNYREPSGLGQELRLVAYATTLEGRSERRRAALTRYDARRPFLAARVARDAATRVSAVMPKPQTPKLPENGVTMGDRQMPEPVDEATTMFYQSTPDPLAWMG